MRNISRKNLKYDLPWLIIAIILWTAVVPWGYGEETARIASRRAGYFILPLPTTMIARTGSTGELYLHGHIPGIDQPAGSFMVIDIANNQCLCRIETLRPGIDEKKISTAGWPVKEGFSKPRQTVLPPPVNITLNRQQLLFMPLPGLNGYYLSQKPFPVEHIEPFTIQGIKQMLFRLEAQTQKKFRADFIPFERVNQLELNRLIDFSNKDRVFLGTREGKVCMISREGDIFQATPLSPTTLERFKKDIYIYVLLIKL